MKSITTLCLICFFAIVACKKDDEQTTPPPSHPEDGCYVQLFDGDNFTDDNIIVEGPAEFSDLENLPGSNKNWNDEADSFKAGKNTIVTFWTETNFEGDSIVYEKGAEEPSIDEPSSMKIRCE